MRFTHTSSPPASLPGANAVGNVKRVMCPALGKVLAPRGSGLPTKAVPVAAGTQRAIVPEHKLLFIPAGLTCPQPRSPRRDKSLLASDCLFM